MEDVAKTLARLDDATAEYERTEQLHADARQAAVSAVVAALRAGARPTDVTQRSPFSPAHVRNIAREHGIEPARKGGQPK